VIRTIAMCLASAALAAGLTSAATSAASSSSSQLTPPCPSPDYGADGSMGPLFCVVDNPVALHYYAHLGRHVFALGPDATPEQVIAAVKKDYSTNPITCSVYRLAAWKNQWHFAISPAEEVGVELKLIPQWCSDPHFSVSN
jgi:hypothetical protein